MEASDRIRVWLTESGWSPADLAKRARISPSTMTRLMHGRSEGGAVRSYELGELVALKLERATVDAWTRGEVIVLPLRAIDLVPGKAA